MGDEKAQQRKLTPHQAKPKAEHYCAYQERSQQEVRDKLYGWGLFGEDVENIIAGLISDNFLNEERFAKAYALGKFRMKGWGKIKIKQHLKAKSVSDPLIRMALGAIEPEEYAKKLSDTIKKRTDTPEAELSLSEKVKLIRFLQAKGFENDLIFEELSGMNGEWRVENAF